MGLSGCYSVVKCLLVLVNIIFGLVGILTVALALWMFFDPTFYVSMAQDSSNYLISTSILFVAGVLLVIVFFLGCFGSLKESRCMLFTFFSILLVVLVAEIAAGTWCYINHDKLEKIIHASVRETVHKDYHKIESRRMTFDVIQAGLECCGADKASDWMGENQRLEFSISSNPVKYNIPESCCRQGIDKKACMEATNVEIANKINYQVIFEDGCYEKLIDALKERAGIIFAILITVVVIELLGLIFALILAFGIDKTGRYKA